VTTPKLAGEILEVVIWPAGLPQLGEDAGGERVAPGTGEVFAEQVGRPLGIAGCRCAYHFDVVSFPVHLAATGTLGCRSGKRLEIGDGEPERRVGLDRPAQCRGGAVTVDGSLRLPVPSGCWPVCADDAAVVLNSGSGRG
jgi:hypothetical protein